jgi:hypothetical protein
MAIDTSAWQRDDLLREARLQTDAIQRLDVWLRVGYSLLAVGFLLGYWGFYGAGGTGFGVAGIVTLVVGLVLAVPLKLGTTRAKANVEHIMSAAGVDLSSRKGKGTPPESSGGVPGGAEHPETSR